MGLGGPVRGFRKICDQIRWRRSQAVEWQELAAACKQSRGRGEVLPRSGAQPEAQHMHIRAYPPALQTTAGSTCELIKRVLLL